MTSGIQERVGIGKVLAFLDQLDKLSIWHRLDRLRDAIMVEIAVPGELWEVEFFDDGTIEIERYVSNDGVQAIEFDDLNKLVSSYADDEDE